MKREHLLVIRFSALGDVAMTVPVVASLAKQYPDIRISVLSRPFARPLFQNLAPNVDFMEADLKNEYKGIRGLNTLFRRLVAKHPTAIADLHDVLRTQFLRLRFATAFYPTAHIHKHRQGKRLLCAKNNKLLVQQPTSFQNYVDVFARLGYPVDISSFRSIFPPQGGDLTLLPKNIGTKGLKEIWIGIAPFAAHQGKMYPIEKMRILIELLRKEHPSWRLFFFGGGEKEKQQLQQLAQGIERTFVVAGQLHGLDEELILMSHLDVMVSMDSGNMHLASITATPVVSIWGATHPYAGFMGWKQSEEHCVQLGLPCRPCSVFGNKPCYRGDFACMNNIKPETILKSIEHCVMK